LCCKKGIGHVGRQYYTKNTVNTNKTNTQDICCSDEASGIDAWIQNRDVGIKDVNDIHETMSVLIPGWHGIKSQANEDSEQNART